VTAPQLVLNLLRGINDRFANTADIIAGTSTLPDFKSATNTLRVKELRLATEGKEASASSLAASTASSCTSPSCRSTPSASSNRGGGGIGKGGKGSKGGRAAVAAVVAAAGATSSRPRHHGAPAVVRVLSRLLPRSASTLGPPSVPPSRSSGVRRPWSPHKRTPPLRRRSSLARPVPLRMGLQAGGIRQADRRPQPDGNPGVQPLGHGHRSDIPHVLQRRYSSLPSPVTAVLHYGRQRSINSCA